MSSKPAPPLSRPPISIVQVGLGAVWVVGFLLFFNSFSLLNNPEYSRSTLWENLPIYYLDLLMPTSEPIEVDGTTIPTGWQFLPQRYDLLGFAGFLLGSAWGLGHLVLRAIGLSIPPRCAERTVLAVAGGLSLISLFTLGCGLVGLFSQFFFFGVLLVPLVAEVVLRFREKSPSSPPKSAHRYPYWQAALIAVMAIFCWCMLLGAMLPSNDFDVNEYHLQGPKEWYLGGRIEFLPHNVYTSFPFLTEMLSLSSMNVRGDWARGAMVGKTLLMSFAPLTALGLFCLGRRWFSETVGWLAAGVYLTTPWVYRVSIIAYTEGALMCYLTVTLLALDLALTSRTKGNWLLVGFFAGSGMACKYPGLISVVIPVACVACVRMWQLRTENSAADVAGRSPCSFGMFVACAAAGLCVSIGPWLLKNLVETGNPVYPLGWTVFGGRDWDAELNQKWRDAHSSKSYGLSDLSQSAVEILAKSDYQSPLIFAFAPLALLFARRRALVRWLWVYVLWLFGTYWLLTHRLDRFWLPIVPLGSLLAAVGLAGGGHALWQRFAGTIFAIGGLFNLMIVTSFLGGLNLYLADLDTLSSTTLVQPPGIAYLNRQLPEDAKVLLVGDANVLDARFAFRYNTVFDHSLFEQWCGVRRPGVTPPEWDLRSADDIRKTFRDEGITHVFVNWGEILRYRTTYRYTDFVLPARFDALVAAGVLQEPTVVGLKPLEAFDPSARNEIEQRLQERLSLHQKQPVFSLLELYEVRDK